MKKVIFAFCMFGTVVAMADEVLVKTSKDSYYLDVERYGVVLDLEDGSSITCGNEEYGSYLTDSQTKKSYKIQATSECMLIEKAMANNVGVAFAFTMNANNMVLRVKNLHKPMVDRPVLKIQTTQLELE